MPWVVGIDEAGYGPNLGPLLQAAVAINLPTDDLAGWETLRPVVRRHGGRWGRDGRLVIDDSKKIYHGEHALGKLERGLFGLFGWVPQSFAALTTSLLPAWCADELQREHWYAGECNLPQDTTANQLRHDREQYLFSRPNGVSLLTPHVILTPTPWFNRCVDVTQNKSQLLSSGLAELLQWLWGALPAGEFFMIYCDKQGGRKFYGEILRSAAPHAEVLPELEADHESRYRIAGPTLNGAVTFRPRSDSESVAVALASMLCKYLRELCMMQFNQFWVKHHPGIAPTAGYPLDAHRFFAEIAGTLPRLQLTPADVWRIK